jgi:regulator of protease activity HflC (stomatin/prohibitin superfamily)
MRVMETFVVLLAVGAMVLAVMSVRTVKQGEQYTVERFGRYTRTLDSGLHFIKPLIERIGAKINVMEKVLDVPTQEVITRDNAMVTVDGVMFYQILDVAKAAYEVANLKQAILNLTMTNLRTVVGSMELDELLSQRDQINLQLLKVVDLATQPWGVKINRIEIRDIQPPQEMLNSMGRVMAAERHRRAVVTEAEGFREAAIKKAEGEKSAAILAAEGRKEAAFRDAEARERTAEAEAKATQVVTAAINGGDGKALNYFVAQQYVSALKAFANSPNQKILMMPVEAAGVLGALGGIAEIAKDAFAKNSAPVTLAEAGTYTGSAASRIPASTQE